MMLLSGFALIITSVFASGGVNATKCREEWTPDPPFYLAGSVSKSSETIRLGEYANPVEIRGDGTASSVKLKPIPGQGPAEVRLIGRGSVVRPLGYVAQEVARTREPKKLVRVRVISNETVASRWLARDGYPSPRDAAVGETGYISSRALEPPAGRKKPDVYVVREDAYLVPFGQVAKVAVVAGSVLKPVMHGNRFRIVKCGKALSYVFDAYDPDGAREHAELLMPVDEACVKLSAIKGSQYTELGLLLDELKRLYGERAPASLAELEISDWGMVRLPTKFEDEERGLDGSFVRYPGSDPIGSDSWGKPHTVCALLNLTREWMDTVCHGEPKCTPQIGDIAYVTPGRILETNRDPLGHLFHATGDCIDMRAFRKDGEHRPMNIAKNPQDYDEALTRQWIAFLNERGVSPLYFNDEQVGVNGTCNLQDTSQDVGKGPMNCPEHNDHIHFCLEPGRTRGCETQ